LSCDDEGTVTSATRIDPLIEHTAKMLTHPKNPPCIRSWLPLAAAVSQIAVRVRASRTVGS
jgi:hypothetical protein